MATTLFQLFKLMLPSIIFWVIVALVFFTISPDRADTGFLFGASTAMFWTFAISQKYWIKIEKKRR